MADTEAEIATLLRKVRQEGFEEGRKAERNFLLNYLAQAPREDQPARRGGRPKKSSLNGPDEAIREVTTNQPVILPLSLVGSALAELATTSPGGVLPASLVEHLKDHQIPMPSIRNALKQLIEQGAAKRVARQRFLPADSFEAASAAQ